MSSRQVGRQVVLINTQNEVNHQTTSHIPNIRQQQQHLIQSRVGCLAPYGSAIFVRVQTENRLDFIAQLRTSDVCMCANNSRFLSIAAGTALSPIIPGVYIMFALSLLSSHKYYLLGELYNCIIVLYCCDRRCCLMVETHARAFFLWRDDRYT